MFVGPLIKDGFTISAYISAHGPWPAFNITYRPATAEKVYDWQAVAFGGNGAKRIGAAVALLTDQLVAWDIPATGPGETLPCLPEHWKKLPHPQLEKILDLVTGYAIPEADPKNG